VAQVSRDLHATALALKALPRSSMIAAAKAAKKVASTEGTAAGSPIQGSKRTGMKLRARDDIRQTGPTTTTCRIQGVNVAGWVWRTYGTAPHRIRRRKRGPKSKMTVPHPGSRGIGSWEKVVARSVALIPQIFDDEVTRVLR
jgi:hypothetical protein